MTGFAKRNEIVGDGLAAFVARNEVVDIQVFPAATVLTAVPVSCQHFGPGVMPFGLRPLAFPDLIWQRNLWCQNGGLEVFLEVGIRAGASSIGRERQITHQDQEQIGPVGLLDGEVLSVPFLFEMYY